MIMIKLTSYLALLLTLFASLVLAQNDGEGFGSIVIPTRTSVTVKTWASEQTRSVGTVSVGTYSAPRASGTMASMPSPNGVSSQTKLILSTVLPIVGGLGLAIVALMLFRSRARRNAALKRARYAWTRRHTSNWVSDIKTAPEDLEHQPQSFQTPVPPSPLTGARTHTRKTSLL